MPGLSLFHLRPSNLEGRVLYPLGELESLLPQVAARARQKYVGREWLPTTMVPALAVELSPWIISEFIDFELKFTVR
jgi:hypothetical protein